MSREPTTLLDRACTPAAVLAIVALGVSAGAMLAEGVVLVPYWRSLPPEEFLDWFGANHQRLVDFYSPVEIAAAVFAVAAAALYRWAHRLGRWMLALSATLGVAVLVTYFLYFQDVNASFAGETIAIDAIAGELGRWAAWQWARISLGIGAFVAAIVALRS